MKLRICHLYGNLLNTYGDNGNLLMLQYLARQKGLEVETTLVSLKEPFIADDFDLLFIGGGQDHEQKVIAKDLPSKRVELVKYIERGGVGLAICGGYQPVGQYYETAHGEKIQGLGALFVEGIRGDYYNVMGLPLCRLSQILHTFGVAVPGDGKTR